MSRKRKRGRNKLQFRQQKNQTDSDIMKFNRTKQTIETDESIAGLLECSYEYSIKETTASMVWLGPKIPQEVWYAVTSFLKWTYDTTKSESQVRLYVSPTLRTWKAWAFPQEARTGMSAKEIANESAQQQRLELALNPPDWFYFGTVHHHCGMGAFQSGTDKENEESQDGLHITVGNMDKPQYDIHARFYRKTMKFEKTLNLSLFFEIGTVLDTWPEMFKDYMPKDVEHKTALKMMGHPVETPFPDQWKANLIEIKPVILTPIHSPSIPVTTGPDIYGSDFIPTWKRAANAWKEICAKAVARDLVASDIADAVQDIAMEGFAYNIIFGACLRRKVDLDDLIRQQPNNLDQEMVELAARADLMAEEDAKDAKNPKSKIPPDDADAWAYMHGNIS